MNEIRWFRIAALLVLCFLLCEGIGQGFTWVWAGRPFRSLSKYRWSAYGLVRNNPDLTMPGYEIDKQGFRNTREFSRRKPPRTLRVLMLGASVLYSGLASEMARGAERVSSAQTLPEFLREELERDPALAGIDVEVINASVNFNRIVEVSVSYLAEYAYWDPDVVIVFGSANNFPVRMWKGQAYERRYIIQTDHPWQLEFERSVNRRSFWSLSENVLVQAESAFASVAWARKVMEKVVDRLFERADRWAGRISGPPSSPSLERADWTEYDLYVSEYLGYTDAMMAVAKRRRQDVAFFWEYFLEHLDGIKPMSADERALYERILRPTHELDASFNFHARDEVRAWCDSEGARFLDPINRLRASRASVFIDYLHYTSEGNRLMARFIHDELRDVFRRRAEALEE